MPVSRLSRFGAGVLATVSLTAGTIAFTGAAAHADPQVIKCAPTVSGTVLGSGPYGATWVPTGTYVSTLYNVDNVPVNCRYKGEAYTSVAGGATVDEGLTYFWRARFVYV